MPRVSEPRETSPFDRSPPPSLSAPPTPRVPDEPGLRPEPRHVLRPVEEYVEWEEEQRLHIPRTLYPDGFDLQWVTESVWGRPETQHKARFQRQGWVEVHSEDFDDKYRGMFMSADIEGPIRMDGLVLCARSAAWSARARANDKRRAAERVNVKERQLLTGDLSGVTMAADHPTALRSNVITRSLDTIAVPQR